VGAHCRFFCVVAEKRRAPDTDDDGIAERREVWFDGKLIRKNGKFLVKALEKLNG
jgi:leucyl aminopeptidase (aminopeptidase T)